MTVRWNRLDPGAARPPNERLAHVLLASVNEIALLIARADDQAAASRSAAEGVDEILTRLLGSAAGS